MPAAQRKINSSGRTSKSWFQKDQFDGKPGIVAQWAGKYSDVAQNWVKADKLNGEYVAQWQKSHPNEVKQWLKDNPDTPAEPKPEDLAVPFFTSFSTANPGKFPSIVEHKTPDGKSEKRVESVKEGSDIQAGFFDMWLQAHPQRKSSKGAGRHGDHFRLGPGSRHYAEKRPVAVGSRGRRLGRQEEGTPTKPGCTKRSSFCCGRIAIRLWAAWSASRW